MNSKLENWVFLGDSLVEGIGSTRLSFVSELVQQLRDQKNDLQLYNCAINYIRLRSVDAASFDRFVKYNIMGYQNIDSNQGQHQIFIWNFASESTTVDSDLQWIPFIKVLEPSNIIIFRGSLESIIRPLNYFNNQWSWWIPSSWRGLVSMDPRCYYSTTWWRRLKQWLVDQIKQHIRLYLLKVCNGKPLQSPDVFIENYRQLLIHLEPLNAKIKICGLLPVSKNIFPGSSENFHIVNELLKVLAEEQQAEFFGWGSKILLSNQQENLFYRDGFHPNKEGAVLLATLLIGNIYH